ncbi:MAG: dihydroorotate dehydrogenase electron transfer subunit [Armatimonadota bacterium]
MRSVHMAAVVSHLKAAEGQFELVLQSEVVAQNAEAGQFVQIRMPQTDDPLFCRPFSIYKCDKQANTFSIIYLVRGTVTKKLVGLHAGDTLQVVGPLGKGYSPQPADLSICVVGGVGAPPVYSLLPHLHGHVVVINGARSSELLICRQSFKESGIEYIECTDDGSAGQKGTVLKPLERLLDGHTGRAVVYTCGSTAMMKAVAASASEHAVPCQVSMETLMPCGIGVCLGCAVKIKIDCGYEYKRACADGPVFDAEEVIWE